MCGRSLLRHVGASMALALLAACSILEQETVTEPADEIAALEQQIVGAWRLVKTQQTLEDGTTRPKPSYGPNGTGYLIYDSAHAMCVFLANPDGPEQKIGDPRGQPGSSMDTPAAYCGRWRLDPDGPAVIHEVELDVFPVGVGDERRRLFTREGRGGYAQIGPLRAKFVGRQGQDVQLKLELVLQHGLHIQLLAVTADFHL